MRRFFLPILLAVPQLLAIALWSVPVAQATNNKVPCYCKYSDLGVLQGVSNEDLLFCPNEVALGGVVDAGQVAAGQCVALCAAVHQEYFKVSELDPGTHDSPYSIVKDETDKCVYSKGSFTDEQMPGWSSEYGHCKLPLNSIWKDSFPESCSFCFCDIKSGPNVPPACVGRSTMVHVTSYPEGCSDLCVKLGYEGGSSAGSYGDKCDYKIANGCSAPANPTDGCKASLDHQTATGADLQGMGTVLSLPLPLSNISVQNVIGRVLNSVLGVVGAITLLIFVWAGLSWMLAAGSPEKIGKAKQSMIWAALGLLAIFSSYALLNLILQTFSKK